MTLILSTELIDLCHLDHAIEAKSETQSETQSENTTTQTGSPF